MDEEGDNFAPAWSPLWFERWLILELTTNECKTRSWFVKVCCDIATRGHVLSAGTVPLGNVQQKS